MHAGARYRKNRVRQTPNVRIGGLRFTLLVAAWASEGYVPCNHADTIVAHKQSMARFIVQLHISTAVGTVSLYIRTYIVKCVSLLCIRRPGGYPTSLHDPVRTKSMNWRPYFDAPLQAAYSEEEQMALGMLEHLAYASREKGDHRRRTRARGNSSASA